MQGWKEPSKEGPQGDPGGRGHRSRAEILKQRRQEGNGDDVLRKVCVCVDPRHWSRAEHTLESETLNMNPGPPIHLGQLEPLEASVSSFAQGGLQQDLEGVAEKSDVCKLPLHSVDCGERSPAHRVC